MTTHPRHPVGRRLLALCACLHAGVFAPAAIAAAGAPAAAVQLQIQARLFYSGSGGFSADVLAPGGPELVNVVASADPSTATLVVVAVKLAPDTVMRSETPLRLTVREQHPSSSKQRVMLDRSLSVGALARGGTAHLAFWLQGTGCRPLHLQARLAAAGAGAPTLAAATLPFACGE